MVVIEKYSNCIYLRYDLKTYKTKCNITLNTHRYIIWAIYLSGQVYKTN